MKKPSWFGVVIKLKNYMGFAKSTETLTLIKKLKIMVSANHFGVIL